jgi:multidrug transporter EmrE-like cation transporter
MIDPNSKKLWRRKPRARRSNLAYKILLIVSTLFGSVGQVLMKYGANALGNLTFSVNAASELARIFTCPYIIIGVLCMIISMMLWLAVLSKLELSYANSIATFSYVLVLLFSWRVFSEHISIVRISGAACIIIGIILVSRTEINTVVE